jgi:hypothetical protein
MFIGGFEEGHKVGGAEIAGVIAMWRYHGPNRAYKQAAAAKAATASERRLACPVSGAGGDR